MAVVICIQLKGAMDTTAATEKEQRWKQHVRLCVWSFCGGLAMMIASFVCARNFARTDDGLLLVSGVCLVSSLLVVMAILSLLSSWMMRSARARIASIKQEHEDPSG
jgi:hypothetical protein